MGRLVTLATILALCGLNSADAVGETKHVPLEKNVQGLIQAGYPRERAEEALRAVGNADCCTKLPTNAVANEHAKQFNICGVG